MLKNIVRLTVAGYIWKRYKVLILSTAILFAYFWLVGKIHDDYISYANLNGNSENIGFSFLLKWTAFVIGFGSYFFLNSRYRRSEKSTSISRHDAHSDSLVNAAKTPDISGSESNQEDPFAKIRHKKKLRSLADQIIDKQQD